MANNFTFKDASGTTLTAKSTDASSVHIPANQVVDSSGNAPTDDGAATGPIYPVAGLYQALASVDEIDTGDVGRARVSARRALLRAPDTRSVFARSGSVASAGDMTGGTGAELLSVSFSALTTAFFDGSDAGFDTTARFVRIPMTDWKEATIGIWNNLGVNITFTIYVWITGTAGFVGDRVIAYTESAIPTGSIRTATPYAGGAGITSNYVNCPALAAPCQYLVAQITPASDPSSGEWRIFVTRRS